MKVEVTNGIGIEELPFPKLMKYIHSELVVFFINGDEGIVLVDNRVKPFEIGEFTDDLDIEMFTDFKGTITITQ